MPLHAPARPGLALASHDADPTTLRQTFGAFPSGVALLAAERDGEPHGLVVSSFMVGVSLSPALVAVAVQRDSETWPLLHAGGHFGVSVFAQGQGTLVRRLGGRDRAARFADVRVERGRDGSLFLGDAAGWFECDVYGVSDAGDHVMVLLEVENVAVDDAVEPLVWHASAFRDLVPQAASDAA